MKRQTVSQPNVPGYSYGVVEQLGEHNHYKFIARHKGEGDTIGELTTMVGTDESINKKLGFNVINISDQESHERKLRQQIFQWTNQIKQLIASQLKDHPYRPQVEFVESPQGDIGTISNSIKTFIQENSLSRDEALVFVQQLEQSLRDQGLHMTINASRHITSPTKDGRGLIITVTRIGEDALLEQYIDEQTTGCANTLINIYERLITENPDQGSINLYQDPEGRKAIVELVRHQGSDPAKLLSLLNDKLHDQGFKSIRPSYDYLSRDQDAGYYMIEKLGSTSKHPTQLA